MPNQYMQLTYEEYKTMEEAMRKFKETTHTSVTGFYYKSIRIPIGDSTIEFHGPLVMSNEGD